MSGKFSKNAKSKQSAKHAKAPKKSSIRWVGPCILLALGLLAVLLLLTMTEGEGGPIPDATTPSVATEAPAETQTPEETKANLEAVEDVKLYIGNGLMVTDIGKYTGVYMEDGSDDIVSGILMIVVENMTESVIQYSEITLTAEDGSTAAFTVSTLPAGESVVLLEKNRLAYRADVAYTEGISENLAVLSDGLTLMEDSLKVQAYEGALNITNISGQDITDDIVIYYKNSSSDMLYGGITYRVRIEGGLKADELRQLMPSHFSAEGSRIMFITIG